MAQVREKIKIPYYDSFRPTDGAGFGGENIHDVSKYWVTMDLFYDDTWKNSTAKRPVAMIHPGAGVSGPYPDDASAVTTLIAKGIVVCVVYYFHQDATDPNHTSMPPWIAGWGSTRRNLMTFIQRRTVNLESALRYVVDNLTADKRPEVRADVTSIYFIGKSQGGASCLVWSWLCNSRDLSRDVTYYKNVKLIIDNQGLVGTTSDGWYNSDRTIAVLSKGVGFGVHPMICVYNDQDGSGGYDVAQRLRSAVTNARKDSVYFVNFKDFGHEQDHTFNGNIILAWQAKSAQDTYSVTRADGLSVDVISEGYYLRSVPLDYGAYRSGKLNGL